MSPKQSRGTGSLRAGPTGTGACRESNRHCWPPTSAGSRRRRVADGRGTGGAVRRAPGRGRVRGAGVAARADGLGHLPPRPPPPARRRGRLPGHLPRPGPRPRRLGTRQAVAGWLHRVAMNAALKLRAGRITTGLDVDVPARPEPDGELAGAVDEELERLPDRMRAAFVLCCLEGMTNAEAARELGCPVGTVDSRLHAARARLRERLTRRGFGPLAGIVLVAAPPASVAAAVGVGTGGTPEPRRRGAGSARGAGHDTRGDYNEGCHLRDAGTGRDGLGLRSRRRPRDDPGCRPRGTTRSGCGSPGTGHGLGRAGGRVAGRPPLPEACDRPRRVGRGGTGAAEREQRADRVRVPRLEEPDGRVRDPAGFPKRGELRLGWCGQHQRHSPKDSILRCRTRRWCGGGSPWRTAGRADPPRAADRTAPGTYRVSLEGNPGDRLSLTMTG